MCCAALSTLTQQLPWRNPSVLPVRQWTCTLCTTCTTEMAPTQGKLKLTRRERDGQVWLSRAVKDCPSQVIP